MYFGRTAISIVAMHHVFLLQDNDINYSDAMCVFLCPDNDINGSDAVRVVYFGRTAISIAAMQCVFFIVRQRYQW